MKNRLMIKDRSTSPSSSSSSTFSQLPHQPPHSRKPKLALLREVFGRGVSLNRICHSFPIDQHFFKFISWFIFASLFSRFHLVLASTSPSQPSISRWGHVLCPAWLQRLILTSYTQKWQRRFLGAAPLQSKWFFFCLSTVSYLWTGEMKKQKWQQSLGPMKRVYAGWERMNVSLCVPCSKTHENTELQRSLFSSLFTSIHNLFLLNISGLPNLNNNQMWLSNFS